MEPDEIEVTVKVPTPEVTPEPETATAVVQVPTPGASEALAVRVGEIGANVETMAATLAEVVQRVSATESRAREAWDAAMRTPEPTPEPEPEPITEIPVIVEPAPASGGAGVPASPRSWWKELLV